MRIELDIINNLGATKYYIKGTNILHREDGPAVEHDDGYNKIWYFHGLQHRFAEPSYISERHGNKFAVWRQHNELHRYDGQAIIHKHHHDSSSWFLCGKKVGKKNYVRFIGMISHIIPVEQQAFINKDFDALTVVDDMYEEACRIHNHPFLQKLHKFFRSTLAFQKRGLQ